MAYADPQTVTINGVANTLPRVLTDGLKSVYQNSDETLVLTISHEILKNGRIRSMARLDQRKVVADPLTAVNDYQTLTEYKVIDRPSYGFVLNDVSYLDTAFNTWLGATNLTKLFGRES